MDNNSENNTNTPVLFDISKLVCYACDYTTNSKSNFKNHLFSMKHHKNVEKMKSVYLVENSDNDETISDEDNRQKTFTPTFSAIPTKNDNISETEDDSEDDSEDDNEYEDEQQRCRTRTNSNIDLWKNIQDDDALPGYVTGHDIDITNNTTDFSFVYTSLCVGIAYFVYTYIK